jgi:hypothetical protein
MKITDIEELFAQMDTDGDRQISYHEFATGWKTNLLDDKHARASYPPLFNQIRALFKQFDVDDDGFITKDEFRNAMKK